MYLYDCGIVFSGEGVGCIDEDSGKRNAGMPDVGKVL